MKELEISQKALDRAEKKQEYRNKLRICIDNYICPKCGQDLIAELSSEGKISILKCKDCDFTWKKG
jgi:ribosomal protein L37AE/L43A